MKTIIRKYRSCDLPALSDLLKQLGYPPINTDFVTNKVKEYSKPDKLLAVAEVDGKVVGFISACYYPMIHYPGNIGRITATCVDKTFRGKGIGKLLLEKAELFCKKGNCLKIEVTSGIRKERKGAHLFYENNGYIYDSKRFSKLL